MSTYEGNGTLVICGRGVTYGAGKGTVEAARLQVGASRKQLCRRYAARLNFSLYPGLAPGAHITAAAARLILAPFRLIVPRRAAFSLTTQPQKPGVSTALRPGVCCPNQGITVALKTESAGFWLGCPPGLFTGSITALAGEVWEPADPTTYMIPAVLPSLCSTTALPVLSTL